MSQSSLTGSLQALFPARLFGATRPLAEARGLRARTERTERAAVVRVPSPSRESAHTELTRAQAQIFLALR